MKKKRPTLHERYAYLLSYDKHHECAYMEICQVDCSDCTYYPVCVISDRHSFKDRPGNAIEILQQENPELLMETLL